MEKTTFRTILVKSFRDLKSNFKSVLLFAFLQMLISIGILGIIQFKPVFFDLTNIFLLTGLGVSLLFIMIFGLSFMLFLFTKVEENENFGFWNSVWLFFRKLFPFFITGIIYMILSSIFSILLFIPDLIFTVFVAFFPLALFFRKKDYFNSFKYSISLVKENWWRTFGYGILISIIVMIFTIPVFIWAFLWVSGFLSNNYILFGVLALVTLITMILNVVYYLFYFNYFLVLEKEKGFKKELKVLETTNNQNSSKNFSQNNLNESQYTNSTKTSNLSGLSLSEEELRAKAYIEKYRGSFSKEAISLGLEKSEISPSNAKTYLEKYF